MNTEVWQKAKEIFDEALQLEDDECLRFLDEACDGNEELRSEVESLLSSFDHAGEFMDEPAVAQAAEDILGKNENLIEGQRLSHYKIISQIGAGGMGEVYLAYDVSLGRKVAIKVLSSDLTADKDRLKRFKREAQTASSLNQPNIITIHEIGSENGVHFIATEYIEGKTLRDYKNGEFPNLREMLDICIQVAKSLAAAHKAGIVHRDIKPENIMIRDDGLVKLLDFGLAKLNSVSNFSSNDLTVFHTRSGILVGTPHYMSPEQLNKRSADARSDLFSLGVVLYESTGSRHPFSGQTLGALFNEILNVEPPPPSQYNSGLPKKFDQITLKLLAKNPDLRYQTAEELIVDLQQLSASLQDEDRIPTQKISQPIRSSSSESFNSISILLRPPKYFILLPVIAISLIASSFWIFDSNSHVTSKSATYWYDVGTEAARNGAYYQASIALSKAIEADNKLALAHIRLAETYLELSYRDRAKEELLQASLLVPDRSALPPADRLYIEAVTATVSGNAQEGIEKYTQIQDLFPDQPQAHVDVGRAYERNNDVKNAVASYEQAADLSSTYAAPFLRLGTLYGRQQDSRSDEMFRKAEEIYQAQGNVEGRTEVYYQRGFLLRELNKISDAREQLKKAYELAVSTGNETKQILSLLQLSSVAFAENNVSQAQQYASQAVDLAQTKGMEFVTARGIVDLGTAFFAGGDHEQAEKYFRQGLGFAQKYRDHRNEARAKLALGSLLIQIGKTDEGLTNVEQALEFYKAGGFNAQVAQALILIGRACAQKGDYDAALQAFNGQLELAETLNNNSQKADAYGGLGKVLAEQERYPEALLQFGKEYEISKSLEDQLSIGYSLANRANVVWKIGDYINARNLFDQAMSIAGKPDGGYKGLAADIYLSEAEMLLSQNQFLKIDEKIQKMQALITASDVEQKAEAKRVLCLKQAFSKSKNDAFGLCQESRQLAMEVNLSYLISKSVLSSAEASIENGDAQNAFDLAGQVHETFARTQQKESDWKACLIMARASRQLNAHDKAKEFALMSSNLLDSIKESWGNEAFSAYLNRPDIKRQRDQLSKLLQGGQNYTE